ncbi:hypothetical protein HX893_03250 [Pseudomonas reactans]|uniref:Surface-adhesin protein E-like domain-containing protein n=1 Tax=Pseudomonas reactans TaxID=117680 RepID=A0A7Y8FXZ1_9PSED|nr:surface-adhesin E family protein [Pseudomonas reactans]NWE87143.1 hypothetical protein [Pseudomonas reactans]
MDARSTALHPAAWALSLLALTGCSSLQKPQVDPGLALFNEAMTLPALDYTILRNGDRVAYSVDLQQNPTSVQFDAYCTRGPGRMFYPTRSGLRAFTPSPATGVDLPTVQAQQLQQSAQLQSVCKARPVPDWRVLQASVDQSWLLIDRNSVQRQGSQISVWAAQDYLHYQVAKNASLFTQRQERLTLDCTQRTITLMSQFNLDETRQMINGEIRRQFKPQALDQASGEHAQLFKALCQAPVELAHLPAFKARQPLPPVASATNANPAVLAAIRALGLPAPTRTLSELAYDYDAVLFNNTRVGDQTKQAFISVDNASGQTLVQTRDSALGFNQELTFQGLFDLDSQGLDRKTGSDKVKTRLLVGLSFQGDWRNLPLASEVSYTQTWSKSINPDGSPSSETSEPRTVTCKVAREIPAATLTPDLKGQAQVLDCVQMKGWTYQAAYLSDYGLFIKLRENALVAQWNWHLKSVK